MNKSSSLQLVISMIKYVEIHRAKPEGRNIAQYIVSYFPNMYLKHCFPDIAAVTLFEISLQDNHNKYDVIGRVSCKLICYLKQWILVISSTVFC